jgi:hypothetical protein
LPGICRESESSIATRSESTGWPIIQTEMDRCPRC